MAEELPGGPSDEEDLECPYESSDVSLLPTEFEIQQDVAGDLEIFVQLAKIGHFTRAMRYFDTYLAVHKEHFPIAAEYAEALIDQGDFGRADDFLATVVEGDGLSGKEQQVLMLMQMLVRMHTKTQCQEALALANMALSDFRFRSLEDLQAVEVCELQSIDAGPGP